MSKRFGRNQKRRMREEIAALTANNEYKDSRLEHAYQEQRKLKASITEMVRAIKQISPNSVCLTPQPCRSSEQPPVFFLPVNDPTLHCLAPSNDEAPAITFSRAELHKISCHVTENWDAFKLFVHLYVGDVKQFAYYVSLDAVWKTDTCDKEIAGVILDAIRKHREEKE